MHYFRQLLCIGVLASFLVACVAVPQQGKAPASSTTTSQSSSEEKAVVEETPKKQTQEEAIQVYTSIFDDYGKILSYAHSDYTPEDVEVYARLLQSLTTKINSWVVEPTVRYPENLRYAFYDIDKDGQLEMLTGSAQSEGTYFVTGLYHIEKGSVCLVAEGFVAGVGGARTAVQLYTDNSFLTIYWSSGTGEATGVLYELDGEDLIEVMQEDFQLPSESIEANFGKEASDILDVNTLDWKTFP
ncbi:hypothetical protein ACVR1I_07305 [Streptococcus cameli]